MVSMVKVKTHTLVGGKLILTSKQYIYVDSTFSEAEGLGEIAWFYILPNCTS